MSYVAAISPITIDFLYSGLSRMPNLGEEIFGKEFDMQIGGGPTAMLITLNKLGLPVELGTFLGGDHLSRLAASLLDMHQVNFTNFYHGTKNPVVVTSIASFPEDRSFLTYNPGIDEKFCSSKDVYDLLKGAKVCFGVKGHHDILKRLKEEGTKIVYDVGWQDDLHIDQVKDILESISIFTPNDKEALKMTGTKNVYEALKVLDQYVECAIITMGREGCITKVEDSIIHIPSIKEFEAVDTTGAGDNFLAGVMYGLYKERSIEDCMKIGNIVGGLSTTALGCCKADISLEKMKDYYNRYYGTWVVI